MRHFAGVLVGILLLPAFFALNWAVNFVGDHVGGEQERWWLLLLLVVYAVVGALAGVLLAWRSVSPTALLLGGVLLIATEVLLALPVLAGVELNFSALYSHPNITDGRLLVAVGVALLVGGFLPTRWHRPAGKGADEAEADENDPYAGAEILPGGSPADETATRQMPSSGRYDASWGTGRNDYVDDPEQPYTAANRGYEPPTESYGATQEPQYEPQYEQAGFEQAQYGSPEDQPHGYDDESWTYPSGGYREPDTVYDEDISRPR